MERKDRLGSSFRLRVVHQRVAYSRREKRERFYEAAREAGHSIQARPWTSREPARGRRVSSHPYAAKRHDLSLDQDGSTDWLARLRASHSFTRHIGGYFKGAAAF